MDLQEELKKAGCSNFYEFLWNSLFGITDFYDEDKEEEPIT